MNIPIEIDLRGDRSSGDGKIILCGLCTIENIKCMLIKCNGVAKVKDYKKAYRCMEFADKFRLPIVSFVNTQGAYPLEAGISYTIAQNLKLISRLKVPMVSIITKYAYSGGAIALLSQKHVAMLSDAKYSVISPKGACGVLKSRGYDAEVEKALKVSAIDNLRLGTIDQILDDENEVIKYIVDCINSESN